MKNFWQNNMVRDSELVNTRGKRICNDNEKRNPDLWLKRIKIPSYPVSDLLKNRYRLQIDCNKTNDKANAYLTYQFKRLWKAKDNNLKLFFVIAVSLIYRSKAFRVSMINRTLRGWYQNQQLSRIIAIFHKIKLLRNKSNAKFSRFYVEKANGKLRPIGSPRDDWKVVLSSWAWILSLLMSERTRPESHGFIPGKGVWTAWREILDKIIHESYIYEFDLKQCFNTIRLRGHDEGLDYIQRSAKYYKSISMESILQSLNIPQPYIDLLLNFNIHAPKLVDNDNIDKEDPELWEKLNDTEECLALLRKRGTYSGQYRPYGLMSNKDYGFPQGSALSPILTLIALENWRPLWGPKMNTIMYADDGLFYTDLDYIDLGGGNKYPIKVRDPLDYEWNTENDISHDLGVKFNREKSGWIKYQGIWKKPLKFLGSTYDPTDRTLNGIPVSGMTDEELKKIVGKVYGMDKPKEWDWEFLKGSLLWRIHYRKDYFYKWWYFMTVPHLYSGYKKWDYNLPIKEASTISCALLLYGLSSKGPLIRKIKY